MANNGRKASDAPPDMGSARRPLAQPERVGSISVAEAGEIRERKRLREKYEDELKAKQDELSDISKIVTLLRVENEQYLQRLLRERDLPLDDDYNVQSETGDIWRTAAAVHMKELSAHDTSPVAIPSDTEA